MKFSNWLLFLTILISGCVTAQVSSVDRIRLNQVGYYPSGPKIAVVLSDSALDFTVRESPSGGVVFRGKSVEIRKSALSGKSYALIDFSDLKSEGTFKVNVAGVGESYPFEISNAVFLNLAKASVKNYYYQRMSIPLEEKYAGKWSRPAGHPDNVVLVHSSAANAGRPTGTKIQATKGWYDAGDYNKYIVNSGITVGTMLSAYEDFPDFYQALDLNIPETGNPLPDLLDELLWNLRWMLAMQDPQDGGVYHKLTNPSFDAMVMPHKALNARYVVQKSTAAALDFAAVTAQCARVFRNFEKQLPGFADSCLHASRLAYAWAKHNPAVLYDQNKLNREHDPDISTGAYGDRNLDDEFSWASAELFATTGEDQFFADLKSHHDPAMSVPGWGDVRLCGYYSLLRVNPSQNPEVLAFIDRLKKSLLVFADQLISGTEMNPYACVMGKTSKDFVWGSSAVAANQAVVLVNAFKLTGDKRYLDHAIFNLDYLLGRNGTGYSFVTGYGDKTPMHPHHRPSFADGVAQPIPGMLSGGPNPAMQDKCKYGSSYADEAFTDDVCSYASNEIAINWNAPLVYLTGAVEALKQKGGYSTNSNK